MQYWEYNTIQYVEHNTMQYVEHNTLCNRMEYKTQYSALNTKRYNTIHYNTMQSAEIHL